MGKSRKIFCKFDVESVYGILIADDFDKLIGTVETPSFLRIANVPLLQLALENVLSTGIRRIMICLKSNENKIEIENYLKSSSLNKHIKEVVYVVNRTLGECFRDIDRMVEAMYYLIYDVLSFNVCPLLELFQRLFDEDTIFNNLIFPVEKQISEQSYSLCGVSTEKNLVYYKKKGNLDECAGDLFLNAVSRCPEVVFRNDFHKTVICAVKKEFISLFTEHFEINNVDDMIEKILALDIYSYQFATTIKETKDFDLYQTQEKIIRDKDIESNNLEQKHIENIDKRDKKEKENIENIDKKPKEKKYFNEK
ncbi:hypothetical protein EDEG_02463 [Edhazardia aedis USNM 41457]|uniref:Uncharacterized protein n=1 Tax=Edhazardia aedis (strain USNM 41457) TaxID=1003232 RepID=J8ZU28_EDHAE|nr:hypothetical protein EDEG_02463 [Edhazardia aedis USNM 41457]|eukprot:EJW03158.1 hypothetical protein EDEG_02463 [Edhazardia aedis USNM 41457]